MKSDYFELGTDRENLPVCPWCGEIHQDYFDMNDGEQECQECGKPFIVETIREYYFTTVKMEVKDGTRKSAG